MNVVLSAYVLAGVYHDSVPIVWIFEKYDASIACSFDVFSYLVGHVVNGFLVQGHRRFVLGKRVDFVEFYGDYAKGCSIEADVGFGYFLFELFSDLFVFVAFVVGFGCGLRYEQ